MNYCLFRAVCTNVVVVIYSQTNDKNNSMLIDITLAVSPFVCYDSFSLNLFFFMVIIKIQTNSTC